MAPPSTQSCRRRLFRASSIATALVVALSSSSAVAGPKDAQAKKALTSAMEDDYLGTEFDKAEKKLRGALDACGDNGCAVPLKAKLYVALGTVLAGGKKQLDDAKEAFVEALKLDKNAAVDPDWASTEINYAFEQARAEIKGGKAPKGPSKPPPSAKPISADGLTHTPVTEQKIHTPIPLWVELSPEIAGKAKKVTASYKGTGGGEWRSLIMKKMPGKEGAYGINIPCVAIDKEGEVTYTITVEGDDGEVLAQAGSRSDPLTTTISKSIEGEAPHWPDSSPPESCAPVDEGPPQCVDDSQCNAGFVCKGSKCVQKDGEGGGDDDQPKTKMRRNLVTVAFVPDVSIVSGEAVCTAESQNNNNFVCLREDGSRYVGTPETEGDAVGNNVNTGPALSTMRVVVGYDRLILDNLSIGVRAGFAFNGAPSPGEFLPIHAELRGTYWIGKQPFATKGARPFVFVSGGMAQVDTKVQVQVLEDGEACGAQPPTSRTAECEEESPDGVTEPRIQNLDAYKQAGFGFVGAGAGLAYAPVPMMSLNIGVRGSVTLPVALFVISPEVGLSFGF